MATYTYTLSSVSWTVAGGVSKSGTLTVDLTGKLPANVTLSSVKLSVYPQSASSCVITVGGQTVTKNQTNVVVLQTQTESQRVALYYRNTNSSSGNYSVTFKNLVVTAEYADTMSTPGAPETFTISASTAQVGSNVTLTWSGARAGTDNAITGYTIASSDSTNGVSWSGWTTIETITSPLTSGSTQAAIASTVGSYRKYRIKTIGTNTNYHQSEWLETTQMVKTTASSAPFEQQPVLTMTPYRAVHIWRRVR